MQPRQVKFLNEADRPKEEKPLGFTEWAENSDGWSVGRDKSNAQIWCDSAIDNSAKQYAAYLATFGDKKPVEPIRLTHRLIYTGATPCNSLEEYDRHDEITCLYNSKKDGMALFMVFDGEEESLYIGYLNSGTY